jgi:hypothetical protein
MHYTLEKRKRTRVDGGQSTETNSSSSDLSNELNNEPVNEPDAVFTSKSTPSFNNRQLSNQQDLFQNIPTLLDSVETRLNKEFNGSTELVIFDPFTGNKKLSNFFKTKGYDVIERDMKTLDESHDFINDSDPESFELIITIPPIPLIEVVLKKVLSYSDTIGVVLLLPMNVLSYVKTAVLLKNKSFHYDVLSVSSKFLSNDKNVDYGWFYFNFTSIESKITFSIIQNGRIPNEEGDEESEAESIIEEVKPKKRDIRSFI